MSTDNGWWSIYIGSFTMYQLNDWVCWMTTTSAGSDYLARLDRTRSSR
jgi:hypothetical protein